MCDMLNLLGGGGGGVVTAETQLSWLVIYEMTSMIVVLR